MRLQLGGAGRVNEVRINPLLNYEQVIWNRATVFPLIDDGDHSGRTQPGIAQPQTAGVHLKRPGGRIQKRCTTGSSFPRLSVTETGARDLPFDELCEKCVHARGRMKVVGKHVRLIRIGRDVGSRRA